MEKQRSIIAQILLSPDENRLRLFWRLAVAFVMLMVLFVVFGIPAVILTGPAAVTLDETGLLINAVVLALAATLAIFLARRWVDMRPFTGLGLHWDVNAWRDLLVGIGITGLMIGLIFLIELATGWLRFEAFAWQLQPPGAVLRGLALMLVTFVLVGWTEELIARGYLLQNLAEGLNLFWAVILSSLIFGLAHVANPSFSITATAGLFLAGLFLAYGYLSTRSLWLPIGLHIGWNFFEGTIFGFAVSGTESFSLIRHNVSGPVLFTGGSFGPEAGLVLLPGLLFGAGAIYLYTLGRKKTNKRD